MKIKKIHILALLNIAAAAAIGISAGMLYKYYMKDRASEKLRDKIEEIVDSVDARIGVGAVLPNGDSLAVYGGLRRGNSTCDSERFPMLSVFKFHQALVHIHQMDSIHKDIHLLDKQVEHQKDKFYHILLWLFHYH